MKVERVIYGRENEFIALPYCVRWIASKFGLTEITALQVLRDKIISSNGDNVHIDIYGKLEEQENEDIEFYLVANDKKVYFPHELEYIVEVIDFLKEYGAYATPHKESTKFFYDKYHIKKRNLYLFFLLNEEIANFEQLQLLQPTAKDEEIARLNAEIAELKKTEIAQAKDNVYEGEIPLQTDRDKLAHFIKLIIQKSEFMKDCGMPTYSELYTMLSHKFPNERIPSKNTLNKYLNP
ncbi:hypothetical protein NYR60_06530 [Actinobacillus genomosp. 2]|uniref:hypothetical protein n=1 Tax=Actinobacillus genomosp. 2 TaxID=230709 RepID=UPI0024414F62|nr:hypothetical protein [Actinobacillus genomosp. 2]WGE31517.1 hypothetical protein NYR60_06530 [Actinobacillus genomosp. 2]